MKSVSEDQRLTPTLQESLPFIGQPPVSLQGHKGGSTAVAVIDDGVNRDRVDVKEHWLFRDGTAPVSCPHCGGKHGTNVAGIVKGVAPDTDIIDLKVKDENEKGHVSNALAAIDWVVSNRARLNIVAINMSGGIDGAVGTYPCRDTKEGGNPFEPLFRAARQAGVVPVVAAGNDSYDHSTSIPACDPSVVGVGAVYDSNFGYYEKCKENAVAGKVTCFSNNALQVLLAPGAEIDAGSYTNSGTSQAAPHVAGAVAVLRAQDLFPKESVDEIIGRLMYGKKRANDRIGDFTMPLLDLEEALRADDDHDLVPNYRDPCPCSPLETDSDSDGDGFCSICDPGLSDWCANRCQSAILDNCPDVFNPGQENFNEYAERAIGVALLGDACDPVLGASASFKYSKEFGPVEVDVGGYHYRHTISNLTEFTVRKYIPSPAANSVKFAAYRYCSDVLSKKCNDPSAVDDSFLKIPLGWEEWTGTPWRRITVNSNIDDLNAEDDWPQATDYLWGRPYSRTWYWHNDLARWGVASPVFGGRFWLHVETESKPRGESLSNWYDRVSVQIRSTQSGGGLIKVTVHGLSGRRLGAGARVSLA